MFDIGWTELLVIGVVALIVIGPKDLPELFRTLGRFTTKARSMARDFQRAMEAAADEAGVKDVAKDLKSMTSARGLGLDAVKEAAAKFEKWDPLKPAVAPAAPVVSPTPSPATAAAPAAAPLGPATQALADAQAAKRAAKAAEAVKPAVVTPPVAKPPVAQPPVAKSKPVAATAKPKSAKAPKTADAGNGADRMAKAIAARKPRAKTTDGGKTDA